MTTKLRAALDAAATIIGAATGLAVAVDPKTTLDPEANADKVQVAAAIARGATVTLGETLGGPERYELQHEARLEIMALGGPADRRDAAADLAFAQAGAAIAANPTLSGAVDYAELDAPDDEGAAEANLRGFAGGAATLRFTFTAAYPTA